MKLSEHPHQLFIIALALAASACDKAPTPSAEASAAATGAASAAKTADSKPADKAAAVSCEAVVKNIASFNPGSGDAEKKLWNKMCAEMTAKQKGCVVAAKDMAGMKACMGDKKLDK